MTILIFFVFLHFVILLWSSSGPNKWRLGSSYTPTVVLEKYCRYNNIPLPRYNGPTLVMVNGNVYALEDFGRWYNFKGT